VSVIADMKAKISRPSVASSNLGASAGWFTWPTLLLGVLGLLASLYCFHRAQQHNAQVLVEQQTLLNQHRLSDDIREGWSQGQDVQDLGKALDLFARRHQFFADEHHGDRITDVADRVSGALNNLKTELSRATEQGVLGTDLSNADSSTGSLLDAQDETGSGDASSISVAIDNLIETTATLRALLARDEARDIQVESAGHLYQLSVSVGDRLRFNTGEFDSPDTAAAQGPWLVFDQILQRMEAMIGSSEITDERHILLINEIRQSQIDLTAKFRDAAVQQRQPSTADAAASTTQEENSLATSETSSLATITARHALLDDSLVALESTLESERSENSLWYTLGLLATLVSTALLALLCLALLRGRSQQRQRSSHADDAREESIHQLLNEIETLAEGNLDTKATVTEGVTGAIADSVNYAVTELRRLVGTLSTSAARVTVAVEETGTSARQLANASAVQSREIGRSSTYIRAMSDTLSQLSIRSAEASAIAGESVELAKQGEKAVASTSETAEAVREQMAQATRMMSRLGDSSRQITRSVRLIDEATDKTRLLAMNTTIKARTSADDDSARQQLAEVADQVQTLANRLGQSAAEIETLITVVRQDVDVALGNMNEIDAGVCDLAARATQAGSSLNQIHSVSERLASCIKHIDERTRRQSLVVEKLSGNMGVINEVTRQSSHGLRLSASALEDLRLMSTELQDSVAEFSLPEKDRMAIAARTDSIRAHEHVGAGSQTMAVNEELLALGDNTLDREGGNNMELIASSRMAAEAQTNQRLNDTLYDTANDTIAAGEVLVDMDHDQTQILSGNPAENNASQNNNETLNADKHRKMLESEADKTLLENAVDALDSDSTQIIVKQNDTEIPNG